jgi:histidyl-tRNA synthetase
MELLDGPSTPGIGFGSGIERIILTMKAQGIEIPELPRPQVLLASLGERAKTVAVRLLVDLRAAGIAAVIAFGDRSLRSQMREASREAVRYAIIIGEDEVLQSKVAVRDMAGANQVDVPAIDLIAWLKENLQP